MTSPSYDSTGFYSSLSFPGYTPPPGAPSKGYSVHPRAGRTATLASAHPQDGIVQSQPRVLTASTASPRPVPTSPAVHSAGPPRTNSPIYAPPLSTVRELGGATAGAAVVEEGRVTPPRPERSPVDKIYSKRRGSSPQLVGASIRTGAGPQPALVRTPSPQSPAGSAAASAEQPARLHPGTNGDARLSNALKAFNDECRDLLSMLEPQDHPTNTHVDPSNIQEMNPSSVGAPYADARGGHSREGSDALAGREVHQTKGQRPCPGHLAEKEPVHIDLMGVRWTLFLVENRIQLLEKFRMGSASLPADTTEATGSASAALRDTLVLEAATKAAINAQRNLLALEEALRVAPDGGTADRCAPPHQRKLCTTIANDLTNVAVTEGELLATCAGKFCGQADHAKRLQAEGRETNEAPVTPSAAGHSYGEAKSGAAEAALKEELQRGAMLLRALQAENAAGKEELQDMARKREKTKRHLKREREAKAEIAKHFDVLAGDNAELHRRIRQLEEELEARQHQQEDEAVNSSRLPVTDEERAELEAGREEYTRLRAQMERQTHTLREVRDELLASERENDTLRRTVAHLRDSLVRHRTVIDLLTREHAAPSPPGPGLGEKRRSPNAERKPYPRVSLQMIEGILAGTVSVPSSSVSSPSDGGELFYNRAETHSRSSSAFGADAEYELLRP